MARPGHDAVKELVRRLRFDRGSGIGSSRRAGAILCRGSISWFGASLDRLTQPLHRELDIRRLQIAPAFDLCLISVFWVTLEIFRGHLSSGRALLGELLTNEGISGHCSLRGYPASR